MILKGAQNPVSAMQLMDFYQQPRIAADVTEYNNYISPVPAAQDLVKDDAAKAKGEDKAYLEDVATSYATFPEADTYEQVTPYFIPKAGAELEKWNSIFEPVYQS